MHSTMRTRWLLYAVLIGGVSALAATGFSQISIIQPGQGAVSAFTNQVVTGQSIPGLPVRLEVNGSVVDSGIVRVDGMFEFIGVPCPRGPVKFKAIVRMRNGKEFSAEQQVHIFGDPDSIGVHLDAHEIQADGRSTIKGVATVFDKWKVKIVSGYFVTIHAESLTVLEDDIDGNTPGHQLKLADGAASFTLRSTKYVGPVTLSLSTNSMTTKRSLYAITPTVPFVLVGSADGTVKHLATTGAASELSPSEEFNEGFQKKGRLAATGRGTVLDNYLLTLSLDTDRKLQDRIFRDLDPNSLYAMYGDNSIVTYEAQSTSPLYAKLEKNQSYILYGDFNTGLTKNEFSAYNRSFTGGKLHLQTTEASLDAFGTMTNRKVVQEEIRGLGISGYYYLRQNNVVTGSEKVRIEVRNRFRSEVVVSVKEKTRYSDYEIDYVQGSLYFKQPVPSLDDQNNPVYIVVSYEANSNIADNLVVGGSGEATFFNTLTLGATTVVEDRDPKDYVLLGGNAALRFGSFMKLRGEAARSSDVATQGSAWKLEGEFTPAKVFSLSPYYRKVDGTFVNATQSGSGREVGTKKYGTAVRAEPLERTLVMGDFYHQEQSQGALATTIRSLSGTVQQTLWNGTDVAVKVEDVQYEGENPEAPLQNLNTHSTLLSSRARASVVEGLHATAEYEHNLKKGEKEVRPDAVGIGLEYQVTKDVALYAQQKFLDNQGQLTTVGVSTKVNDGTSVYGKYEIGNTIAGERNAATIGLKNTLKITEALTTNFLYEKTKNLSKRLAEARTDDHDAISLSFEYLPVFPLRATVKGEYSEDANNLRKGFDAGLTYRLFNDLSVMTKGTHYRAVSRVQSGYTAQAHYLFGLAFRPVHFNWLNLIAKVEHKVQDNQVVVPTDYYRATIVSAHAYVEPLPAFEIGVKYALKDAFESFGGISFSTLTDFILCRPQYDITQWLNVAGEVRLLRQREARDMKVGYSGEMGFVFIRNTMISFGYNFQAYKSRDLVDDIYSVKGPYVTLRLKFTEELFGGSTKGE